MVNFNLLSVALREAAPVFFAAINGSETNSPNAYPGAGKLVHTTSGAVQGTASDLRPDVSAYLGIPFAKPPVGSLRFAPPVAYGKSDKTIDATKLVSIAPLTARIALIESV